MHGWGIKIQDQQKQWAKKEKREEKETRKKVEGAIKRPLFSSYGQSHSKNRGRKQNNEVNKKNSIRKTVVIIDIQTKH